MARSLFCTSSQVQPHAFQLCGRDFPHAGDLRQRQRSDKLRDLMRRNHKLTIGFIHIGGDFRQKFYRRDTGEAVS
jgi:hypothetical protein